MTSGKLPIVIVSLFLLLGLVAMAADVTEINRNSYEGPSEFMPGHLQMLGKPAPPLELTEWINGDPTEGKGLEALKGKVVLVDFWAVWCAPCIANIPHVNELAEKYADAGLVVIGACGGGQEQRMPRIVNQYDMKYPTAKVSAESVKAWQVSFWPTYAVVDREGNLRAIGLKGDAVEAVVKAVLEEQPQQ